MKENGKRAGKKMCFARDGFSLSVQGHSAAADGSTGAGEKAVKIVAHPLILIKPNVSR